VVFLFPIFLAIATAPAEAIKTEYLYLTNRGNDMAPAICDGDTVKVKICTNGTLIQAGSKNSTHPGDIIVYCAGAAVAVPKYMWMCGRAVKKYWKDGEWCFKTQLDSSPEPDAWEVPEHYLLGVVVEVTRGANPQNYQPTSNQSSNEDIEGFNVLTLVVDLFTGIVIGAVIGAAVAKAYTAHERTDLVARVLGWFKSRIHH
jgi:hypothetical protein